MIYVPTTIEDIWTNVGLGDVKKVERTKVSLALVAWYSCHRLR
jgi:hypothetical protein